MVADFVASITIAIKTNYMLSCYNFNFTKAVIQVLDHEGPSSGSHL